MTKIIEQNKQLECKTQELELAEQLINGILKTLNLEAYNYKADQNEILTEIKAFKQECEELKAYAQRQENQREEYYKEYLKKYKALEKIEFEVTEELKETEADTDAYGCFLEILNIINKAKERE